MSAMQLGLRQIADWLPRSRLLGDAACTVARVHTDTRTLQPGDLFVALQGERYDAADFFPEAARKGAAAILCASSAEARLEAAGLPGILVPDARWALAVLARHWRRRFDGPLIAVTGSNGKTTVTQMIAAILRAWMGDAALATDGNLNNDIGVPLTLLRLREEHRTAVLELGMNHPGEISLLAGITAPTVALVNNAQREHQEFMASVEAVARENGSVFMALAAGGTAVFPADDEFTPLWRSIAGPHARVCFGEQGDDAAVRLQQAEWRGERWAAVAQVAGAQVPFELVMPGRHNLRNALAALACAHAAGAPVAAMATGLGAFRPVAGRSQVRGLQHGSRAITLIDDTYNANPDSVRALIDVLAMLPGPRLLVLGDMGEVGEQGVPFHSEVGRYARQQGVDYLLALGPLSVHAAMAFGGSHFDDIDGLVAAVRTCLTRCASVAVKGSRFMRMERVVQALERSGAPVAEGCHAA